MSTWMEKLEGKFEEGLDAARVAIRAKAGESQTLCEPSSPYWLDLRQRAKLLEASLEGIGDEVKEFLSLSGWSAKEQAKGSQLDLQVEQEDAHEDAVETEWTEEPKALPPASEAEAKAQEPPGRPAGEPAKRRKSKPTWRDRCSDPIEAFNAELLRLEMWDHVVFEFPNATDRDEYADTVRFVQHGAEPETVDLPIGAALYELGLLQQAGLEGIWEVLANRETYLTEGVHRWDDAEQRWVKCRKKKAS